MSNTRETSSASLAGLVGDLATDVQDLVRGEIRLARAELDQKIARMMTAGVAAIGGALVAFAGLVTALQGGAVYLTRYVPAWAAFLIVGAVILLIGAVIARLGMGAMSLRAITPQRTAANLRKDALVITEHS
jgi:uncharacterized membrane protein YqjE